MSIFTFYMKTLSPPSILQNKIFWLHENLQNVYINRFVEAECLIIDCIQCYSIPAGFLRKSCDHVGYGWGLSYLSPVILTNFCDCVGFLEIWQLVCMDTIFHLCVCTALPTRVWFLTCVWFFEIWQLVCMKCTSYGEICLFEIIVCDFQYKFGNLCVWRPEMHYSCGNLFIWHYMCHNLAKLFFNRFSRVRSVVDTSFG
jgi:hypothetical protein